MIRHQLWGILALAMATTLYAQQPPVPGLSTNAAGTNCLGPRVQFQTPIYDFGRVRCGDPVKYSFIFTNTGDRTLEVTQVQPTCHCTTAGEWSRTVEPGKTGTISVQFDTANYSGAVAKAITVSCKDLPASYLQLKGTVWKPIDFPPYAFLNLSTESGSVSNVIRIVNNMEEPITLAQPEINNRAFNLDLETNKPGKDFLITVSTLPPMPVGTINAEITVKTSSTNAPVLKIPLWANVQPALMVMPQQIILPQTPLSAKATPAITIQYNGTNSIEMSEPAVNVAGVDVQLQTMSTGRVYSVALSFPKGFELQPGQQAAFTLKTTHPQYPQIRVPVIQPARPIAPQPAPGAAGAANPAVPVIAQPAAAPAAGGSH